MNESHPALATRRERRRERTDSRVRRDDIDGLRALAILLVVAYHVWTSRVSGGVDVFLMISAYFLTASFVRRLERGGSVPVLRYWVRRFARLLPLAGVTILATLGAVWLWYLPSTWPDIWGQTWASLFYFQNWELAFSAVDYYARDEVLASPLQHFWSLSVQGQVFLVWPLLIAGTAVLARRRSQSVRLWLIGTISLVGTASFVYSVAWTAENQAFAYGQVPGSGVARVPSSC